MDAWIGTLKLTTLFGDAALWAIVALNIYWLGKRKAASWLLAAILFDVAINKVLKYTLMLPRPDPAMWLVQPEDPYGFPSGHAETAALVASFLSLASKRRRTYSLFALALAVALSRYFLGIHNSRDIAGGLALGASLGAFFHVLYRKVEVRGEHLRLASLPTTLVCLATALYFPVRPAMFGGFIAGSGAAMALPKLCSREAKLGRVELAASVTSANAILFALLAVYAASEAFTVKFAAALSAAIWALAVVPAIQARLLPNK